MKPKVAFVIATNNLDWQYKMFIASLRKFHSEEELPVIRVTEEQIKNYNDPNFLYRGKPTIAKKLIQEYELVIGFDCDQLITGDLSEIWKDAEYDVAVVNNSNPNEFKAYPYTFLTIHPFSYVNCGLVAMRSEAFINEWYDNCFSILYNGFQMREQDFLNLLVHGNHYKVKRLDEGDSFYSLASKGYWQYVTLTANGELFLAKDSEGTWPDKDKLIKVIHFAGGHENIEKMNYRIRFQPEVIARLDELIK